MSKLINALCETIFCAHILDVVDIVDVAVTVLIIVAVLVVVVDLDIGITPTSIAARPVPTRRMPIKETIKQTGEHRPQMSLKYLSGTFSKYNNKNVRKKSDLLFLFVSD